MSNKPYYDNFRSNTPSGSRKWISRYEMEPEELQNLDQQKPQKFISMVLDLTTAQAPTAPLILNFPGRAISMYGISTSGGAAYDPVANTGIEPVATAAFIWAVFDNDRSDLGIPLKHNRGYRGDFWRLKLAWPAQSSTKARIYIYKFDDVPWQNGEAAT